MSQRWPSDTYYHTVSVQPVPGSATPPPPPRHSPLTPSPPLFLLLLVLCLWCDSEYYLESKTQRSLHKPSFSNRAQAKATSPLPPATTTTTDNLREDGRVVQQRQQCSSQLQMAPRDGLQRRQERWRRASACQAQLPAMPVSDGAAYKHPALIEVTSLQPWPRRR